MAEVFRAVERTPPSVGEPRALVIKRMLPSLLGDPVARAMFAEERRLGALVDDPHVVRVLGGGELDGQPYLALEWVPGLDLWRLGRWLTRRGATLGTGLALYVADALLRGLEAVHGARDEEGTPLGIVHRDVSPSNVLLSLHGDVKLADLGIASTSGVYASGAASTDAHAGAGARARGKLGYVAPEQLRGTPVDQRADLYAACVVTVELLLGRPLFVGGSELAVLLAIRDGDRQAFEELAATLPPTLAATLRAGLAIDPAQRPPDARALREALTPHMVEPASVARAELAEIVRSAVAELGDDAEASAAVARTPVVDVPAGPEQKAGAERPTTTKPAAVEPHDEGLTRPTRPAPSSGTNAESTERNAPLYEVRTVSGQTLGVMTYACVVERIATAAIGPDDQVSVRGGPFTPVRDVADLRGHLPMSTLTTAPRDQARPGEADSSDRIEDGGLVRALAYAALACQTGLVLCEQGGVRKEIYVEGGRPEFVSSNLASELLGEFLVARGVISRGELDMALAVLPRFDGRLGDTLTALGLVEPLHLFRYLAEQVREKLLDTFTWTAGNVTVWQGVERPRRGFPLGIDPWEILREGILRRIAAGFDDALLMPPSRLLVRATPARHVDARALPLPARAVLARLSRPRSVLDLAGPDARVDIAASALPEVVLLAHLGLVRAG
jgi:serine/threonine-protein kinase